jgi:hypothetical protein
MSKQEAAAIARVTKAIHRAASTLPRSKAAVQTIKLAPNAGSKAPMKFLSGKINTPVQPSYYVAVIIPVYRD